MNKSELWADPEWRSTHWGNRRGRPWTGEELVKATGMRIAGFSDSEIAVELNRTEKSVTGKLGYQKS